MMKLSFLLLLAILSSCFSGETKEPTQTPSTSFDRLLLGTWQSLDDKKSQVIISNKTYTEYYQNMGPSVLTYKLTNFCQCDNADTFIRSDKKDLLVTKDESSCYCYEIIKLNKDYLELGYSGRGPTLRFRRIK
jgi:hypothetical protein